MGRWRHWGLVVKPHGLKGGLKVRIQEAESCNESPGRLYVAQSSGYVPHEVLAYSCHRPTQAYVWLAGVSDVEAAESFRDCGLYLPAESTPKGLNAWSPERYKGMILYDQDQRVGAIEAVYAYPHQTLWGVRHNGQEVLVPACVDWLERLSESEMEIHMRLPANLLSLNA